MMDGFVVACCTCDRAATFSLTDGWKGWYACRRCLHRTRAARLNAHFYLRAALTGEWQAQ